jgi:ATP-binding cassette subfamily F protein 3
MISTPANLLIMDEPTNHLDMNSQEILQQAMTQYDGSIIVVSHNRYFVDSFVNKVLEIKNGQATIFDGNISYYLEKTATQRQLDSAREKGKAPGASAADTPKLHGKEARQAQAKLREERNRLLGPLKKNAVKFEKEVEDLERSKKKLENLLADPELYSNQEAFTEKNKEYSLVAKELEKAYAVWEETLTRIEEIDSDLADN